MSDAGDKQKFMDIMAEYDQFANDVDLSFRPAEIGAGEFTVVVKSFSLDTVMSNDVENCIARVIFLIGEGQREGDSLRDEFWFPRGADKATMAQRSFLLLARCLSNRTVQTMAEAIPIVKAAADEGTVLLISLEPWSSRRTGKSGINVNYKSTVAA